MELDKNWPTEHTEHTENTAHRLFEFPRIKKPWCLGALVANFFIVHKYIFFSLQQSPKSTQGIHHTQSLAPLGFWRFSLILYMQNQSRRTYNDKKLQDDLRPYH
ncbi:MAG: hypothetical protein QG657_177 [Acidobacteriota bacterium]|nr:hypothetical protein [Acidobacteriota bacterium]